MITMYKWQQVKAMQRSGIGAKTIAKQLDLSKNTVKKYMRSSEPPSFDAPERTKLCDAYRDEIADMLKKGYIGTRIFTELGLLGYAGSLSSLHRYIAGLKTADKISTKATTRVETEPGEQMQYDWKEWVLPVAGRPTKVYFHELVLCYSRKKFYAVSLRITAADILRAIIEGIYFFGGAAKVLVTDNPKQIVTERKNGQPRFSDEFLMLCGTFGIEPFLCAPYRAQTKGKVERPFYYLQEHLLRGLTVESIAELDRLLAEFTDAYNEREHSTLKEAPNVRFEHERALLRPVATIEPGRLFIRHLRKVSNDGYVSYEGNLYPVPMRLCLRDVFVEPILAKRVVIFDAKGTLVAEHEVPLVRGVRPTHPEHEAINEGFLARRTSKREEVLSAFIEAFGNESVPFIEGIKLTHGTNMLYHLSEILAYAEVYEAQAVKAAILSCTHIGSYHKTSVRRLLDTTRLKPAPLTAGIRMRPVSITRELSAYRVEVTHAQQ